MIFENLEPRLKDAISKADETKESVEVSIIYNEIGYPSAMTPAFEWLFTTGRDFQTRHDEYKFVLIILPKN